MSSDDKYEATVTGAACIDCPQKCPVPAGTVAMVYTAPVTWSVQCPNDGCGRSLRLIDNRRTVTT